MLCSLANGRCTGSSVVRGLYGSGSSWLVCACVAVVIHVLFDAWLVLLSLLTCKSPYHSFGIVSWIRPQACMAA